MFVDGYMVDFHKCDAGEILLTVSYIKPGGNINHAVWSKQAFIIENHRNLMDFLSTIVNYIASLNIPAGGYARISI